MATRIDYNDGTITNKFADDVVVSMSELAIALRTSRWTIRRWMEMEDGYQFQFGKFTTPGHAKQWLEVHADKLRTKSPKAKGASPTTDEEAQRMEMILRRLV